MSTIPEYWHSAVTDRSYAFLQGLRTRYEFVLIGGWAVYLYTHALKSKDIDLVCDHETLSRLKDEFSVEKNDRLKKYEIKADGFDIDIYVPHWSDLGLAAEEVSRDAVSIEGFMVPTRETLVALKLVAHRERKASLKGMKDRIDIISLLSGHVDYAVLRALMDEHPTLHLNEELMAILKTTFEASELGMNKKKFADFKKRVRAGLGMEAS